jgi:serine/threonine protein phosphatase PrpC
MCLAWQEEADLLLVAVADGVSSAPLSHIGASTVSRYAVERLIRDGSDAKTPDWQDVLQGCAWALVDTWQRLESLPQPDPIGAERQLATTLCIAVLAATDDGAIVRAVSVGDSGVAMVRQNRIVRLLGRKAPASAGIQDPGVIPLPRVPDDPASGEWPLHADETLLIGTDGIWDPLGNGQGAVAGFLIGALGHDLPPRLDFLRVVDFCRDTYDDDRTLVAVRLVANERVHSDDPAVM